MAFLGLKKKKKPLANPDFMPEYNTPVEQVQSMKQQGYTNDQIVQALQQQGYTMAQISEAMGQPSYEQQPQQDFFSPPPQYSYDNQQQQYQQQGTDTERVQEVVEAVIEEKWSELVKDIKVVIEWKDKTEARLAQLQQQISDLKLSIDSVNSAVLGRLSDYDKSVTEVGTGIKAMEKVFQKVLPSLTDSISRLERVSKKA